MIKHIVMIRLRETDPPEAKSEKAKKVKAAIDALLGVIPELRSMEVGLNLSTRPSAYDLVLTSVFDSPEGLDVYRNHPEHQKVMDLLYEVMEQTAVVDYEF